MLLVLNGKGNLVVALDILPIGYRVSFICPFLTLLFPFLKTQLCGRLSQYRTHSFTPQVENMINWLNYKEILPLKVPTNRCCWLLLTEMLGRIHTNELNMKSFKTHEPYRNYYYNFMLKTYIPHISYIHKISFKNTFITVDNIHHVYNKMYSLNWL